MSALGTSFEGTHDPRHAYLQSFPPSFAADVAVRHLAQSDASVLPNTVPFPPYLQHYSHFYPSQPSPSLANQNSEFGFAPVHDWSDVNTYHAPSTASSPRPIVHDHSYLRLESGTPPEPHTISPEPPLYARSQPVSPLAPFQASPPPPLGAPLHLGPSGKADRKELPGQKLTKSSELDPYAADFLREELGDAKWNIFTARLAERRVGKHRSKSKLAAALLLASQDANIGLVEEPAAAGTASVIDFLVKVELVKAVLRAYVPHPYNPLKSLAHPFERAPSGHVMLTRSAILSLCGWSNTQFSYWARRAEAVSVLAPHDARLRTVAGALLRHLRAADILGDLSSGTPTPTEERGFIAPSIVPHTAPLPADGLDKRPVAEVEDWIDKYITGKGLDALIDEVKKRSGASQFLRGRHSSLDPFGAGCIESEPGDAACSPPLPQAAPATPAFQADSYVHDAHSPALHTIPPNGGAPEDVGYAPAAGAPYHVDSVALPARTMAALMMPIPRKAHSLGIAPSVTAYAPSGGQGPAGPLGTSDPTLDEPAEMNMHLPERPRKKRKSV